MSHVFARSTAFYTPLTGVVDLLIGQHLRQQADGSWITPCGTKVIQDPEVVASFLNDGSLVLAPVAPAPVAAVEPAVETAEEAESEEAGDESDAGDEAVEGDASPTDLPRPGRKMGPKGRAKA